MNLGQLRAALQAKGYGTDTVAQQNNFLNEAYRKVHSKERWQFLEAQDSSLLTIVNTSAYTLPFTFRNLDAVRIAVPTIRQFNNLRYMDVQEFRNYEHIDRDVSTPFYWTFYANQLHFYPVPDQVYTVTIDYILMPPDLSADGDTPVLPAAYHDILVWGAVKSMAARQRDWVMTQIADQEYETMLRRMEEELMLKQRQSAGHVRKSGYWETQLPYPFVHDGF